MKRALFLTLLLLPPRLGLSNCAECHKAYKTRDILNSKNDVSACRGELQRAVDEVLYIEKRFAALKRIGEPLADKDVGYQWIEAKMEKAKEAYDSFLNTDVVSLQALVEGKGKVCEKLRVPYLDINDSRDELKKRHLFGTLVLGSLVLLVFGLRAYLMMLPGPKEKDETPGWVFDPKRDDEPYRRTAARVPWPEVKPRAKED